jgi:hypothetical protein
MKAVYESATAFTIKGTVWPWLIGPFVEAWVRVHGESDDAKRDARTRFLMPIMEHLNNAGLGHVSEIATLIHHTRRAVAHFKPGRWRGIAPGPMILAVPEKQRSAHPPRASGIQVESTSSAGRSAEASLR